jgi:cytochrome c biogenesis protein CcmG, thiol:disulfide interchange protein DsbE
MTEAAPAGRRFVTPLIGAAVALAVVFGFWYYRSPESTKIKAGMMAPELNLPTRSSAAGTKLSMFRGHPILLVMFMSTCHVCAEELPQLEHLHREFRPLGLVVTGVDVDADYAARERFLSDADVSFGVFVDPNGVAVREAYGSWKMPEAYLIDATGRVDSVYLGSVNWRSPEIRERIRKLLAAASAPAPRLST